MHSGRITWNFAGRWGPILSGTLTSQAELIEAAHPIDRARLMAAARAAREQGEDGDVEWRFQCNGRVRWIRALGKVQRDAAGRPRSMIGICVDVTERRNQQMEHRSQREKLAHLTLAATVGELAGTLAHEISQPLAAIMLNATVAQQVAQKPSPDMAELRAILADILADDQRAADVIHRLHALLPRGPIERESVQVADCINDILALEHSDLIARNVVVELDIEIGTALREWRWIRRSTVLSMVAEKKRLWRFFGSNDRIFSMAGRKPMSSMRSASSRTTVETAPSWINLRPMKSSRRPGVAMTTWTPRRKA